MTAERIAELLTLLTLAEVYHKIGAIKDMEQAHKDMRAILTAGEG
jgi:hypothetical protein